jgi:hypothetical protein
MNTYELEIFARDRQRELLADARPSGFSLVEWIAARLRGR